MTYDTEAASHLDRVRDAIGPVIRRFLRHRLTTNPEFRADDLRTYVLTHHPRTAPSSPTRILQDMRKRGEIDYELVSRKASLYRAIRAD